MNDEIKINKANRSITFVNNGIAFSQFGIADEILDLITNLQHQISLMEEDIRESKEINGELQQDNEDKLKCIKSLKEQLESVINENQRLLKQWFEDNDKTVKLVSEKENI